MSNQARKDKCKEGECQIIFWKKYNFTDQLKISVPNFEC